MIDADRPIPYTVVAPLIPTTADLLTLAMSIVYDACEAKGLDPEVCDRIARDATQNLHLRGLL